MASYLFIFIVCFSGAFLQSGIGFGAAVLMVNVLPFVFLPAKAIVISQSTCVLLNSYILWKTRHHVRWDVLVPFTIPALVFSFIAARLSIGIDVSVMKIMLGILFIVLSIYYSFVASKIKIRPTKKAAIVIGTTSGIMNGLTGSGGPPAILYLMPALEKKEEYLASAQLFFLSTNIVSFSVRLFSGVVEKGDVPSLLTGMTAGLLGALIGMKFTGKLNGILLKRFVYVFIGINGLVMVLNQVL